MHNEGYSTMCGHGIVAVTTIALERGIIMPGGDGNEIVYHDYYKIGIAVSTERGLVVPVVRDADQISFAAIESMIGGFATKAREGTISVDNLRGGTFTITGNGTNGVPNGVIFSGSFTGTGTNAPTWTVVTLANGTHNYTLHGAIVDSNGRVGATTQITVNTGKGFFNGEVGLSSGDTNLSVPEPGTLGLLGTGLVGIAGLMRRKFWAK